MRHLILLLVLVEIVGLGCSSNDGSKPEPSTEPAASATEGDRNLRLEAISLRDETSTYLIDVVYPRMGFLADSVIKRLVDDAIADFKNTAVTYPPPAGRKYTLRGTFDSPYLGAKVVSVRLVLAFETGGAHPYSTMYGLNFDPKSGRQLTLTDALSMLGLTISQVADQAVAQLRAKPDALLFPEGASPDPKNYDTFLIGADKVTFLFQEYQVTAYAFGPQEVTLAIP